MDETEFVIERDNLPDLRFLGRLIAAEGSSDDRESCNYSGEVGRWTNYYLYRTKKGRFVCAQDDMTLWIGHQNRHSGAVCATPAEVIGFFGQHRFAKRLYEKAGIANTEDIE